MPRTNRIQQIYGYLVCLITIVTLLISVKTLIDSLYDLTRPQTSGIVSRFGPYGGVESGESFESFRLNQLERYRGIKDSTSAAIAVPSDSALRVQYENNRRDAAVLAHWETMKSIITSLLMIVLAGVLFTIHWRWLRSLPHSEIE